MSYSIWLLPIQKHHEVGKTVGQLARHRMSKVCGMLLLSVLSGVMAVADEPVRADAASPALRRWAILAAPEVREAGISDLLAARLSERKFELVERDQLEAVLKELKLSQ